jgi:hypothetical protein
VSTIDHLLYYAGSTGAMRQDLSHVELRLRLALKTQRTEIGLRREMVDLLSYVSVARAEQHARDVEAGNVQTEAAA